MTDDELTKQLRDLSAGPSDEMQRIGNKAADCIEQLVKEADETHKEAMAAIEMWGAALKGQREAEAKLAKAVGVLVQTEQAIMECTDEHSWRLWGEVAVSDIRATLAELEKTE